MPSGQLIKPANIPVPACQRRAGLRAACWIVAAWLVTMAPATRVFAQNYPAVTLDAPPTATPNIPPAVLSSNRFLFVVDISAAMGKHTQDIADVVESVLRSSASGQLHDGDSIGVWTFNEDVYTGQLPLQRSGQPVTARKSPCASRNSSGGRISERKAGWTWRRPPSPRSSKRRTSSPSWSFPAAPARFAARRMTMRSTPVSALPSRYGEKPMPLVTVLQGKRGKFIRYTVNALPWPVIIPELPIPLKLPAETPPAHAEAPEAAPQTSDQTAVANATPIPTAPPVQSPSATPPVEPAPTLPPPAVSQPSSPPSEPASLPPQHIAFNPPPYPMPVQTSTPTAPAGAIAIFADDHACCASRLCRAMPQPAPAPATAPATSTPVTASAEAPSPATSTTRGRKSTTSHQQRITARSAAPAAARAEAPAGHWNDGPGCHARPRQHARSRILVAPAPAVAASTHMPAKLPSKPARPLRLLQSQPATLASQATALAKSLAA